MEKQRPIYKITAWTVVPCPYETKKSGKMDCQKMCHVNSPLWGEHTGECVFRKIKTTNSRILFTLMTVWYGLWYDYMDLTTECDSDGGDS